MHNFKSNFLPMIIFVLSGNLFSSKLLAQNQNGLKNKTAVLNSELKYSKNLLPNADFMARDPQQRPFRWIMGMGLQTASISAAQKHGTNPDDRSLKLEDSSQISDILVRSEKKIARPGTNYMAQVWAKTGTGTPANFNLEFWDQNDKIIGQQNVLPTANNDWQQQTISLKAPDKTTHVTVSFSSQIKETGVSFWDDVSLVYEYTYQPKMETGVRELFLDDYRLESMVDVQLQVHPGVKTKPLIKLTEPWEGDAVYVYGTVLNNEPAGTGYRMWYTAYLDENYYLCYATSKDGKTWQKPKLGIYEFKGSKANNICKHGGGTLIYDAAETNPDKRYKLMDVVKADSAKKKPMGYGVFFSKDGLNWVAYKNNPVISYADVSSVTYDKEKGLFIAATKQRMLLSNTSVTQGKVDRAAFISISKDFINWTAPDAPGSDWTLAVEGDHTDDLLVMSKGGMEGQIYGMTVYPYEKKYIGMPWAFDITSYTSGIFASYGDGPIQPQIAFSRELKHWSRPIRVPILPLGKAGAWDDGAIYTESQMQVSEKQIELYYGGMNMAHGGSSATQKQIAQIAKASWRRDGFVSMYNAGDDVGVIVTKIIIAEAKTLLINTKLAKAGNLKVEILDENNAPIPGFTFSDAKAISGDKFNATVRWKNNRDVQKLAGKKIKLKFYLKGGDLFSYWFSK